MRTIRTPHSAAYPSGRYAIATPFDARAASCLLEARRAGEPDAALVQGWCAAQREERRSCLEGPWFNRDHASAARKRVLFVSEGSAFSGAEASLVVLVKHLGADWTKYAVCALEGTLAKQLREAGAQVIVPGFSISGREVAIYERWSELIRDISPSVVHLNGETNSLALAAFRSFGVPIIQHVRVRAAVNMISMEDQLRTVNSIVCISHFVAKSLSALGTQLPPAQVVYNGVDEDLLNRHPLTDEQRTSILQSLDVPAGAQALLCVARNEPRETASGFD